MIAERASRWHFGPAPKTGALSERVVPVDETERRARAVIRRLPVTRLNDLTPLDQLGLPVFGAITPLARDLTTHLGKGEDAASARVSALMEAVERVSAESLPPEATIRASYEALSVAAGPCPANPAQFDLPADTTYAPQRPFDWVEAFDLGSMTPALLPADLACNPPREGLLRQVDTNGLASGNTLLEALVHALCEVVERDAISQHEFRTLYGEPGDPTPPCAAIDLETVTGPAALWIDRIRSQGLHLVIQDIGTDIRVATFRACVVDMGFPTLQGPMPARFPGYGTHPNAQVAVLRAVTEAIQSRLATIQGARDAYNILPYSPRRATLVERAREISDTGARSFAATPTHLHDDLRADLRFLIEAVGEAGFGQVLATDLTRADLGLPVVRVRIPGLAMFAVNRRRPNRRVLRYLV